MPGLRMGSSSPVRVQRQGLQLQLRPTQIILFAPVISGPNLANWPLVATARGSNCTASTQITKTAPAVAETEAKCEAAATATSTAAAPPPAPPPPPDARPAMIAAQTRISSLKQRQTLTVAGQARTGLGLTRPRKLP